MDFFCATTAKQAFIFAGSTIFSLFDGMLRPCSDKRLYRTAEWTGCRVKEESDLELSRQTDYFP